MSNVVSDKWSKMYKLISQNKLIINCDVSDDYKCGICKNILINAHQAICGCNFCYECINRYMTNGSINCPNDTEECELESLLNIAPNHKVNKLISKLFVKCSNQMCSHECQLIEMENHLNSCFNKSLKCPFNKVGCEHDDMIDYELNDHMLSDIRNHNKILIDLIGKLQNEIRELNEEIKLIQQKNEELTQQMEIGDRNLWKKIDEIVIEINNKCKKDELLKEFVDKFNKEMNVRFCDMKQECNEKLDEKIKIMKEENEKLLKNIEISNKVDKYLNMKDDGELLWQIDKINQLKLMRSEYFYDKQNPYKMFLRLGLINNELNIWLHIHSGAFDDDLKWPCQADITIDIYTLNHWNILKTVTKTCTIEKPENNSSKWDDPIIISQSDWTKLNLNNVNCLLICVVKFK